MFMMNLNSRKINLWFRRLLNPLALMVPAAVIMGCAPEIMESPTAEVEAVSSPQSESGQSRLDSISAGIYTDIAYASTSPAQKLDLYIPDGSGPFPLVVIIHGGGFISGDKTNSNETARADQLMREGFAAATINYRLSEETKYPAQIHDAKAAVRFLRANAVNYNLDADHFGAWGSSAGGSLAALLGTTCGVEELEGIETGNPDSSSCIQAVVDWFGLIDLLKMDEQLVAKGCQPIADDPDSNESQLVGAPIQTVPELVAKTNPMNYIDASDAPFFIQHGAEDCRVPPAQSENLAQALAPVLGEEKVTFMLIEGADHGGVEFKTEANLCLVIDFFNTHLR